MKALEQGVAIAKNLSDEGIVVMPDKQIVAVIAYLQKLGHYDVPELENKLSKTPLGVPPPSLGSPDRYRAPAPVN